MKTTNKLTSVLLASLLLLSVSAFTGCGKTETENNKETNGENVGTNEENTANDNTDEKMFTVGISQFAEHGSLDNCREGFIEGLRQEGFEEGKNITFIYRNASADTGNATTIAKSFAADGVDLMCAVATPSAQACFNAANEDGIPVIYTAITDPEGAGLADGGEITGTSDVLPVEAQLKTIREILPDAEKIGILYTTSESNSEYTLSMYEKYAPDYNFTIVTKGVTDASEVALAIESIMDEVDCFSNLTDNTVVNQLDVMLEKANEAGKPIFGSEIEQVKKGCVAAEGLEYFDLGVQTGKMAAQVLKGEKKASEIPFEIVEDNRLYVNKDAAEALGITLSDELSARAEFVSAE